MQDIHTHLYWESYDADREAVLARAQEAGVAEMLIVGTTVAETKKALSLVKERDFLFATAGIHPNEVKRGRSKYIVDAEFSFQLTELEELMSKNKGKVLAVGECGLDYSKTHGDITQADKLYQKKLFESQLQLAEKFQLPVIVHCRATKNEADDAYWDLLEILKLQNEKLKAIILHCYMGSTAVTKAFLEMENVYFSFTGNITYPVKKEMAGGPFDLAEVVKLVPLEKIFVETDCPFLTPQAHRGKRNEPAYVVETAKKVAELHQISVSEVEQKTGQNFREVFQGSKD